MTPIESRFVIKEKKPLVTDNSKRSGGCVRGPTSSGRRAPVAALLDLLDDVADDHGAIGEDLSSQVGGQPRPVFFPRHGLDGEPANRAMKDKPTAFDGLQVQGKGSGGRGSINVQSASMPCRPRSECTQRLYLIWPSMYYRENDLSNWRDLHSASCQVSAWQSATLLPISCK